MQDAEIVLVPMDAASHDGQVMLRQLVSSFGCRNFWAYSIIGKLFLSGISPFQPFFLFYNFFEHIFEHINGPLLGLC